jgi:hypothetical protein
MFRPIWPSSGVKISSGETTAVFIVLLLHMWSLRCAHMYVTWRFLLEFLYVKFLYIMWLLVCVLTVLGVSCSLFFFFIACFVLECLLGWTGSSFIMWVCCYLLFTSCIISGCGCRCMCRSFVTPPYPSYIYTCKTFNYRFTIHRN